MIENTQHSDLNTKYLSYQNILKWNQQRPIEQNITIAFLLFISVYKYIFQNKIHLRLLIPISYLLQSLITLLLYLREFSDNALTI